MEFEIWLARFSRSVGNMWSSVVSHDAAKPFFGLSDWNALERLKEIEAILLTHLGQTATMKLKTPPISSTSRKGLNVLVDSISDNLFQTPRHIPKARSGMV